jgi:hypothetical protein
VRRRDDNAVSKTIMAAAVVDQDCPRDNRCRRKPVVLLDDSLDAVSGQNFERCALGRPGQRMRVLAHV